uniref:Uncharacterized protein n=1 Tax=Anguilla anguilla TaxID=7936 RepID=A0A0E9R9J1_ANGAN
MKWLIGIWWSFQRFSEISGVKSLPWAACCVPSVDFVAAMQANSTQRFFDCMFTTSLP